MASILNEKPIFIEVCAGAGGMSSGFIKAGFQPLLLNDIDKNCCKTLEKKPSMMQSCMRFIIKFRFSFLQE